MINEVSYHRKVFTTWLDIHVTVHEEQLNIRNAASAVGSECCYINMTFEKREFKKKLGIQLINPFFGLRTLE